MASGGSLVEFDVTPGLILAVAGALRKADPEFPGSALALAEVAIDAIAEYEDEDE
jgi:hypothetical protein